MTLSILSAERQPAPSAGSLYNWAVPALLFVATLAFYCINLDDGLPVHDELYHVLAGRGLLETGEPRIAEGMYPRGYLYTWLVAQSFRLFGDNLFAARLPAALPMAMLVAALFCWLRATAGTTAAWIGTLLFATSPLALGIAQFARFYGLQSLAFFLGAIALPRIVLGPGRWPERLGLAVLAAAALMLAVDLQDTTLLGIAGLALWSALALGLWWWSDPPILWGRQRLVLLALGLVVIVGVLGAWASGQLPELWHRYRWVPVFNEENAGRFWFYHLWLGLFYPSLWPVTGLLGLLALVVAPRPAGLALVVFATAFLLGSIAGPKNLRYMAYAMPFLFALWGIGLAALWPRLRQGVAQVADGIGPAHGVTARWGQRLGAILAGAAILFLLLANPAWLRTATLLADVSVPPEEPYVRWSEARPVLQPWMNRAGVVVTTSELETLYHLGRYDLLLSRSRMSELPVGEQHEFGRDWRTGRPVITQAATVGQVIDCTASGLLLTTAYQWSKTFHADAATKELIEKRTAPLPLPNDSRVLAWTWQQPQGWKPAPDCAGLPLPKPPA